MIFRQSGNSASSNGKFDPLALTLKPEKGRDLSYDVMCVELSAGSLETSFAQQPRMTWKSS